MKWEVRQLSSGWWSVWFDGQFVNASLKTEQEAEVVRMMKTGEAPRHNTERYNLTFINQAVTITAAVTVVSYIMYTVSPSVTQRIGSDYVYLTSVFVILGLLRYMQLTLVDEKSGDPTKMLYSDHFLQLVIAMWFASYLVIIYV